MIRISAVVLALFGLGTDAALASCAAVDSIFVAAPPTGNVYSVTDFALADFNGDGILDAVTPGVLLATGTPYGSFEANALYAAPSSALRVAAADLNDDGWPDVAVTTQQQHLLVLLNRQDGTFAPQPPVVTGFSTRMVRAADVDGDGLDDLVVAGSAHDGDTVNAFLSNGDGTLRAMPTASGVNDRSRMALGDFNGDARVDALVAGGILLGDGQGRFAAAVPFQETLASPVAAGDLNGDGRDDIVAGSPAGGISIFLANADGTMQKVASVNHPGSGLAISDVDRDGKGDVILGHSPRSAIVRAGANGDWSAPVVTSLVHAFGPTIAFADMNADGTPDLISSRGQVRVHYNSCDGTSERLVPSRMSSFIGQELALSYSGSSDGTVTFAAGGTVLGTDSEYPYTLKTAFSTPGDYVITATHQGADGTTMANVRHRVFSAPSTLSIDASAIRANTDSLVRVRVEGPGDTVDYAATSGAVTLHIQEWTHGHEAPVAGGVATFPAFHVSPGTHRLRAVYSGGTLWPPGETEITITVQTKPPKGRAVRK